ncbi:MAG: carboxypeptidase-like regulatory domain-containing protein [Anditalea sp.]
MKHSVRKIWSTFFFLLAILSISLSEAFAQSSTAISGTVTDADTGEPLIGVNILVKGQVMGTISDVQGKFSLNVNQNPPLTLVFSMVGYTSQEVEVSNNNVPNMSINLSEQFILGQEIVVSASRMEESILQSPVSIEKMDILEIRNTPADTYYKAIGNLKGVDITSSSINFQIINARGFNSTGNSRFVQLTDGMDTQAPALNFPIGNLNGPSELDVESLEFIPGASSALYGPNAFNGILLVQSKSPFEYQGLSAFYKQGINHINGHLGEPQSVQPMYEGSIRYAHAFNNKLAFKLNASFMGAEDWYGTDQTDLNERNQGDLPFNPGENRIHVFGDEVSTNIGVLRNLEAIQTAFGEYANSLPDQVVSRTGYDERHLLDYGAENYKFNGAIHYRVTDRAELSYTFNYGSGTSVYTGAQRYSFNNFEISQHKLELRGDNFYLRGYTTRENAGDSYIADLTGVNINNEWRADTTWFTGYTVGYLLHLKELEVASGSRGTPEQQASAHNFARGVADVGRFLPGTTEFENAKENTTADFIPTGSLFNDRSRMYMAEGQYDFKNEVDFMDLQVGGSYRLYELRSNGTIFADVEGNDITITELGAFAQASKRVANDQLKFTGSLRFDKNENFDGQFSPRLSAVFTEGNSNFRAAFQTGFRNPITQAQHIDLNVVAARLIGGLPYYREKYNIFENAFSQASVNQYIAAVGAGRHPLHPAATGLLERVESLPDLRPEQVKSVEVGYKGLLAANRLLIDFAYYYNLYNDFITQTSIRKASGPVYPGAAMNTTEGAINAINASTLLTPITIPGMENTFQTYTNLVNQEVRAHGAALGLAYNLPSNFILNANYNYNELLTTIDPNYLNDFNTPEHKTNITFGNRKIVDNLGFNITYRYQSQFRWESAFAVGDVPEIHNVDAQVSYKVSSLKTVLKLGGSNIFNTRYFQNFGGPTISAIYYLSITFDELLN